MILAVFSAFQPCPALDLAHVNSQDETLTDEPAPAKKHHPSSPESTTPTRYWICPFCGFTRSDDEFPGGRHKCSACRSADNRATRRKRQTATTRSVLKKASESRRDAAFIRAINSLSDALSVVDIGKIIAEELELARSEGRHRDWQRILSIYVRSQEISARLLVEHLPPPVDD